MKKVREMLWDTERIDQFPKPMEISCSPPLLWPRIFIPPSANLPA
jgi:hypothetical protein